MQPFFDNFALLSDAANGVPKLRELILQLAVEGKLVSQDLSDEPATKLVSKINANKERLVKERKIKNEEVPEPINQYEPPFAPPDNWQWVRLSQVANAVHYGYTASANQALTEVRLLRITDIQNGRVDWASVPGCEINREMLEGVKLANNDILIARTGGPIGKSYLVENLNLIAVFASYLIRVIPNENLFARYLKVYLESELYWSQLYKKSMGTGQPNVNATSLKSLLTPLPPLEEQKRIVAKVEELMQLCHELEFRQQQRRDSSARVNNATLGGGKTVRTGRLDVAVIQSLTRRGQVKDLVAEYGQVIVDECHHVSAFSFERVLRRVKAKYVLGLTATPIRKDGHHPIILMQCGPIRFSVNSKKQAAASTIKYEVLTRSTPFTIPPEWTEVSFQDIYTALVNDEERNNFIVSDVVAALEDRHYPPRYAAWVGHCCLARAPARWLPWNYRAMLLKSAIAA